VTDNVIQIRAQYSADDILDSVRGKLENVLVIGWTDEEPQSLLMTTTPTTIPQIGWLLDVAKQSVMDGELTDDE